MIRSTILILAALMCGTAFGAKPAITFEASVTKCISPCATTLTWDVKNAESCTADRPGDAPAWRGDVPLSGTRKLSGMRVSTTLDLTCTAPSGLTGNDPIRWSIEMKNTDGSALTDLKSFLLQYGNAPDARAQTVEVQLASARDFAIDNLPPGVYYFGVRALTLNGEQSDSSNIVTRIIAPAIGETATQRISIEVHTKPVAPVAE